MVISNCIFTAIKTTDQAVTSSTALADAAGLGISIQANANYAFQAFLPYSLSGILGGAKFSINGPASPTGILYHVQFDNVTTGALGTLGVGTALDAAVGLVIASAATHVAWIRGTVRNGSNAGTLTPRFAQNVSDSSASTLLTGASFLVWQT